MLNVVVDFHTSCNTCPFFRKTPTLLAFFSDKYIYYCSNGKKRKKDYSILDSKPYFFHPITIDIPNHCPKLATNNINIEVKK